MLCCSVGFYLVVLRMFMSEAVYIDRVIWFIKALINNCFDEIFFFFNDTATTYTYTLSLHDALPICVVHEAVEHTCFYVLEWLFLQIKVVLKRFV